ncbi:MAG: trimeric intracellular cation channel family protein [Burkholderiaceae bacterium]
MSVTTIAFDRLALTALEIAGTLAFAMSGLVAASRRRMDIVGVAAVSFFAAFGGGTLRDLLLDRRPFFWVEYDGYVWAVLALALFGALGLRIARLSPTARPMLWADALGLGLFAASGAGTAAGLGQSAIVCALMGVVTAVFGGVMRDLLCNEIPVVFRDRRPYAICAFAGAWVYLAVAATPATDWLALTAGIVTATGLRLLSLARDWHLPAPPEQADH